MRKSIQKGFSLLEVVFAFAILELALLAIIGAFPAITRLNKQAWNQSVATQLAQEKMEEILAGNRAIWSTGVVGDLTDEQLKTQTQSQNQLDNPTDLSSCTRMWWGEQDPSGSSDIQVIRIRILWQEGKMQKSVTLCSLFYY